MKKESLYNALQSYKKLKRSSFHTPGHKNSKIMSLKNLFELDFTELPNTDNLYEPENAIKEAEFFMAKTYGSKYTLFSAGGCTLCIQTMLKLALPYGGKIIASRMIHRSAVNTMALLDAKVEWIMPEFDYDCCKFRQISAIEVEKVLKNDQTFDCVYITSPDYFGNIADIKSISKVCHKYNVPLLVDNAHGSHLKFLSKDIHPVTLGADIVADSSHKTMPVLTGGALLHITNENYIKKAKECMALFGSTSPSYPIMASLDRCRMWLNKEGKKAYIKLENDILKLKIMAKEKKLLDNDKNVDPIRIVLNTANIGYSGNEAAEYFREKRIEPEISDQERVVFISTPMNKKKDFIRLSKAIKSIQIKKRIKNHFPIFEAPVIKKTLKEALFSKIEQINVVDSLGRISASTVSRCPPGIPVLVPGEIITENSIKNLLYYGIFLIDVIK